MNLVPTHGADRGRADRLNGLFAIMLMALVCVALFGPGAAYAKSADDFLIREDLVARTGTAHFSLLLPNMNKYGIRTLANRISRELDGRILKQSGQRVQISVSIGIVAPDMSISGDHFEAVGDFGAL